MTKDPADPRSDQYLVDASRSGDRSAFAELVLRYEVKVRGYCRQMLRDHALAEDAAQEVFLKAYTSMHSYRGEAKFLSWLLGVASNYCIDQLRKKRVRSWLSLFSGMQGESSIVGEKRSSSEVFSATGAQDSFDLVSSQQLLNCILERLSAEHRSLLIMHEGYGLTYEEIAKNMGVSLNSIRAKIKRARRAARVVKAKLEGDDSEEMKYESETV